MSNGEFGEERLLDIWSKSPYPVNVLSNLHNNSFCYGGIECGSMGGMYAQQMRGYNRICVNPAFFEITPEIICHHAEMEEHQFDGITEEDREQVWGLFADNDQQVNGSRIKNYCCPIKIHIHNL